MYCYAVFSLQGGTFQKKMGFSKSDYFFKILSIKNAKSPLAPSSQDLLGLLNSTVYVEFLSVEVVN